MSGEGPFAAWAVSPFLQSLWRWRGLSHTARLYLLHVGLLTSSLAIFGLFFNIAILAFGFSLNFLGVLNSVSFVASAVLAVPLLWLAHRLDLRQALVLSAMLQAAGALVFALWPVQLALLAASGVAGAGAVLFEICAPPFMMKHSSSATRDQLFSANMAIRIGLAGCGSLIAGGLPSLGAWLLHVAPGSVPAYQFTLLIAAVGMAFALLPLLFIGTAGPPVSVPAAGLSAAPARAPWWQLPPAWRELARQPVPLLKLLASPALISFGAALLLPYLNLFFKQRFGVPDQSLGFIFAALGICTGIASLAGPAFSARIGKIRTVVLTQALALPFLALLGVAPVLSLAVGAALVRAALFNMGAPLYDAFAMERSGEDARPTVIALVNGAYSVGYAIAPLLSTQLQQHYGFGPLFAITLACYVVAVWLKYWFFVRNPTT